MSATVLSALVTAGFLGITHAIEPDHVAGISSLTSEYADSRLSALAGVCFSLGHVALVVIWLLVAYLLLGQTEFASVYDTIGTVGVGIVLGLLGAAMAVGGLRRAISTESHEHDGHSHTHTHVSLPLPGFRRSDHDHDTASLLKTGLVGALFTLSPPVSMILFSSTLFPDYGAGVVGLAVVTYAIAITTTMGLIGAGAGAVFGITNHHGPTYHGIAQAVAGVAVVCVASLLLVDVVGPAL